MKEKNVSQVDFFMIVSYKLGEWLLLKFFLGTSFCSLILDFVSYKVFLIDWVHYKFTAEFLSQT